MAKKPPKPTGDYPVGYCRPPEKGKIQPDEVRNPHGRNGKPQDTPDAFTKVIAKQTRVTIDGETMLIPSDEAFYLRQLALALAGDRAAARIIAGELSARRKLAGPEPSAAELKAAQDEQEERERLSAQLVTLLNDAALAKKASVPRAVFRDGKVRPEPADEPPQPDPDDPTADSG